MPKLGVPHPTKLTFSICPKLGTFCAQIIIEFTNNHYYGHHHAKESEVDQKKHSEGQYLEKKSYARSPYIRPEGLGIEQTKLDGHNFCPMC
jgi:hypothetical protein